MLRLIAILVICFATYSLCQECSTLGKDGCDANPTTCQFCPNAATAQCRSVNLKCDDSGEICSTAACDLTNTKPYTCWGDRVIQPKCVCGRIVEATASDCCPTGSCGVDATVPAAGSNDLKRCADGTIAGRVCAINPEASSTNTLAKCTWQTKDCDPCAGVCATPTARKCADNTDQKYECNTATCNVAWIPCQDVTVDPAACCRELANVEIPAAIECEGVKREAKCDSSKTPCAWVKPEPCSGTGTPCECDATKKPNVDVKICEGVTNAGAQVTSGPYCDSDCNWGVRDCPIVDPLPPTCLECPSTSLPDGVTAAGTFLCSDNKNTGGIVCNRDTCKYEKRECPTPVDPVPCNGGAAIAACPDIANLDPCREYRTRTDIKCLIAPCNCAEAQCFDAVTGKQIRPCPKPDCVCTDTTKVVGSSCDNPSYECKSVEGECVRVASCVTPPTTCGDNDCLVYGPIPDPRPLCSTSGEPMKITCERQTVNLEVTKDASGSIDAKPISSGSTQASCVRKFTCPDAPPSNCKVRGVCEDFCIDDTSADFAATPLFDVAKCQELIASTDVANCERKCKYLTRVVSSCALRQDSNTCQNTFKPDDYEECVAKCKGVPVPENPCKDLPECRCTDKCVWCNRKISTNDGDRVEGVCLPNTGLSVDFCLKQGSVQTPSVLCQGSAVDPTVPVKDDRPNKEQRDKLDTIRKAKDDLNDRIEKERANHPELADIVATIKDILTPDNDAKGAKIDMIIEVLKARAEKATDPIKICEVIKKLASEIAGITIDRCDSKANTAAKKRGLSQAQPTGYTITVGPSASATTAGATTAGNQSSGMTAGVGMIVPFFALVLGMLLVTIFM